MTVQWLWQMYLALASEISQGLSLECLQRWCGDSGGWQAVPHGNGAYEEWVFVRVYSRA